MGFLAAFLVVVAIFAWYKREKTRPTFKKGPLSVNYHFTRHCNYSCGFCYHVDKPEASPKAPLEDAKYGLRKLAEAGMKKLNFSGGEPFLYAKFVGDLAKYCKVELKLPSVSIVTNGSKVRRSWFQKYGQYVDMIAVSCDSFDPATNNKIGRRKRSSGGGGGDAGGGDTHDAYRVSALCKEFGIIFRLNTVVNTYNHTEDMTEHINALNPYRWKVFQCLDVDGENQGAGAGRDVAEFLISKAQFEAFVQRHDGTSSRPIVEDNEVMRSSYWLLDEELRLLDCSEGGKTPGPSLREPGVTVEEAIQHVRFDEASFKARRGEYDWSRGSPAERQNHCETSPCVPEW